LQAVEDWGAGGEAFDGGNGLAFDLANRYETTADGLAVDKDRASAAVSGVAAYFGAGQAQVFAQDAGETLFGARGNGDFTFVDSQLELAFGF
jgi:hypothetical protein